MIQKYSGHPLYSVFSSTSMDFETVPTLEKMLQSLSIFSNLANDPARHSDSASMDIHFQNFSNVNSREKCNRNSNFSEEQETEHR